MRDGLAPKFALQLEATEDPPIWIALEPPELDRWAGVLERMWTRWGTAPGETIAFFEYGSSPLVLLASSGYVGYLRRGAAERLGLNAVCNDGVAAMAARMVAIIETLETLDADHSPRSRGAVGDGSGSQPASTSPAACDGSRLAKLKAQFRAPRPRNYPRGSACRSGASYDPMRLSYFPANARTAATFHLDREYRAESLAAGHVAITARFAKACPGDSL